MTQKTVDKFAVNGTDELLRTGEPLSGLAHELRGVVASALNGAAPSAEDARRLVDCSPQELPYLCKAASEIRDVGRGRVVTFSPKVFIPLTRLCRDFCGYCTFRQDPGTADRLYMTPDEVLDVARAGERLGCTEALLTLGERPEQRYPEAREWLRERGYRTTLEYLYAISALIVRETSLLPHGNAGTMSFREVSRLKEVNASMGLMLENVSERLRQPGGPHELAPSKWPTVRLKTLEIAGRLKVPFTTGILIGIGETREEIIESLVAIRELHRRYGHIQEVIVQNFRAKPGTAMSGHPEPAGDYLLWTVAVTRIILGPDANIQVPPNLSARDYPNYMLAGINDWGGVSPLTIDFVNPEAPWPQLSELRSRTEELGFELRPRLPVYPEYVTEKRDYLPRGLEQHITSMVDDNGYVKGGIERYARSLS